MLERIKTQEKRDKISLLKLNLAATDYIAIKYAEGAISEKEYAPIKRQRQEWRNEINKLQGNKTEDLADLI